MVSIPEQLVERNPAESKQDDFYSPRKTRVEVILLTTLQVLYISARGLFCAKIDQKAMLREYLGLDSSFFSRF